MDNHFSQDHCLPRELPCLPWGGDGYPSWKGGWRRRSLLPARVGGAEGTPPRQPPPSHRCVRVLSPLTCQFSGSPLPGGGENFQKMNPGHISGPNCLWPCRGSPACGGAPCFCMEDVCLSVSCSHSQGDCFWPWCCRLLEAGLWTSQLLALLGAQFLHW